MQSRAHAAYSIAVLAAPGAAGGTEFESKLRETYQSRVILVCRSTRLLFLWLLHSVVILRLFFPLLSFLTAYCDRQVNKTKEDHNRQLYNKTK